MSKIQILPPHEAHKIAAGEVIERPAHILKELIENSIDAQALHISIFIKQGGKSLIRVIDDGMGMDLQDALLCFEKHATSKIKSIDDIPESNSFGFRGEALATVAAVARVTLRTKEEHAETGIEVQVAENKIISSREISCVRGTDISVHDLFYQIPARKKFLKTDQSEWRAIHLLIQAYALDYPSIGFSVTVDDKQLIHYPAIDSLEDRWKQVYENHTKTMLFLDPVQRDDVTVTGIISHYQDYAYDRNGLFFFVNKRWVKNQALFKALMNGYAHVLPAGRFAKGVVNIVCDPHAVDINIHPRKEEVKFLHPRIVEQMITTAVTKGLEKHVSVHIKTDLENDVFVSNHFTKPIIESEFGFMNRFIEPSPVKTYTGSASPMPIESKKFLAASTTTIMQSNPTFLENDSVASKIYSPDIWGIKTEAIDQKKCLDTVKQKYAIIGQYHKTYILIEQKDGLFLVDQHAAHERILYEEFASRFKEIISVPLIVPTIVPLSNYDMDSLLPHLVDLQEHGIVAEQFGDSTLIIQAMPPLLQKVPAEEFIRCILATLDDSSQRDQDLPILKFHEKVRALMACKAAIKAGDVLSLEQMEDLLESLDKTPNRFSCPHGRPTGLLFSLAEIEKKFKRKK